MSASATKAIRIILIEDHGIVREGLKLIMQQTPDIVVVGEADTGLAGVRLAERLSGDPETAIDVVVTDLGLPDISGIEVTKRVKEALPHLRVLVLSMHHDAEHVRGMLDAGADGYLLKQSAGKELAEAIRVIASGKTVLAPAVTRRLMSELRRGNNAYEPVDELTERERQILAILAEGATSKQIAHDLDLSRKTVENHRARILEKLGVANTAAAIGLAYQRGLIPPPNRQ